MRWQFLTISMLAVLFAGSAQADSFFFSTGSPTNSIAMASRPGGSSGANQETEAADDFTLSAPSTRLDSATFTGLLPANADVSEVHVEIYRVFPNDSTVPPSGAVPTRANSPSDVAFDERDSASNLTFSTVALSATFTTLNSVDLGIHAFPGQTTGGDGSATGREVQFNVTFTTPFDLPPDHYFFVPQVLLLNPDDHFLWLSAARPNVTTPFAPDLQAWMRNDSLDPDWLRVGTDIVGGSPAPTFNAAFSLAGETIPEPASYLLLGSAFLGLLAVGRKRLVRGHTLSS
jgi:hypothetical protein